MDLGHLIPRNFKGKLRTAVRGEGVYLYDEEGNAYMDGCCGALLSNIGHGVREIADAIHEQLLTMEFAHPSRWNNRKSVEAAAEVASLTQDGLDYVWFVSGGSEAIESAMKMARQYFVERDGAGSGKFRMIARWNSYHGGTTGTMGLAGNMGRRRIFAPLFLEAPKIQAHYCYRCPYNLEYPGCGVACAHALEDEILRIGAESVAAFFAEPVVGSTVGALHPPKEYWPIVREICTKYDVLLVADEIMSGMGRTGKPFCTQHWDVTPDIVCSAKALSGGYAPVGAMIVSKVVAETIRDGSGAFQHGFTYNGNPVTAAAVIATIRYMKENKVFENAAEMGRFFDRKIPSLYEIPVVGEIRGMGMMRGIEIVANRETRAPFPPSVKAAALVTEECMKRGLVVYPGTGQIGGVAGDQFLFAPPLNVSREEMDTMTARLEEALKASSEALKGKG
ncbi:MAG: aspartate aminotransferase family protein [Synergistota bacterium]|nr:aspartate aminotransferase family protein [Synergistota bacterium]OPZ40725.1 MAG: Adenosylmethionine-8-amino-7-oxononanoate aminotransferase [Synergistetes bacterium ADurb.BinA166]